MSKKIITGILVIIVALVAIILVLDLFPVKKEALPPVEPETHLKLSDEDKYLQLKYYPSPEIEVFDLSMDLQGDSVLFGSNTKKVTLIDGEGRLKWEQIFESDPLQTKISACGNFVAVGTSGGKVLLMHANQDVIWEKNLVGPVNHLVLSPSGRRVIAGSGTENGENIITFYDRESKKEWFLETNILTNLRFSPEKEIITYSEETDDSSFRTVALNIEGEIIWQAENFNLVAMSLDGEKNLLQQGSNMIALYNHKGSEQWSRGMELPYLKAFFNPQNGNLLLYKKENGKNENLFYLDQKGELLWDNIIEEKSLITFSSDGKNIIYCSGKEFDNNFSKLIILNEKGTATKEFEITLKVEKLIAAEKPRFVFLAGKDGSVYQIDLTVENGN